MVERERERALTSWKATFREAQRAQQPSRSIAYLPAAPTLAHNMASKTRANNNNNNNNNNNR